MVRKLHAPDLPRNERRRITQTAVDLTKRRAFKECLGPGKCKGSIEGGHLIPRSWLRKIGNQTGEVRIFTALPINPFKASFENSLSALKLEHVNNVFVGSFTCRNHEEMYEPTEDPDANLSDYRTLNLLAHKPITAALWQQKLLLQQAEAMLAEVPEDEASQFEVELQRQRVIGLQYYKQQAESCLRPKDCAKCKGDRCKVIGHKVFHIPGEPAIAVSDCSDGIRTRINPRFRSVEYIMNWGVTVLPFNEGHTVIFHHFIEEERISVPVGQLLSRLQGKKLQGEISYWILKSFEHIAINPARWEQFGENRRRAILEVFFNEIPDLGFGSMERIKKWERDRFKPPMPAPNPHQINLFNPNKR